ncbi:MAG: DUF3887 domain-containing protein, partial [Deltaproteobacteria bacterium]|nr:DUF3887 domain-containing protein [Deltaproteobacteria bacterium]
MLKTRLRSFWPLLGAMLGALLSVPAHASSSALELQGRALVQHLAKGQFKKATSNFDSSMKTALPVAKVEAAWRQLEGALGAFKRVLKIRSESTQGYRIVFITCAFEKQAFETKIVFSKAGKVTGLFFIPVKNQVRWTAPPYAKRASFDEQEITFGQDPWKLPATLTMPKGRGPFPAVVLVHGSGPNNRDERVGAIRVFKDIAWGLASKGIAVFRYDKRTLVHGKKIAANSKAFTLKEETVDDGVAAVEFLQKRAKINAKRIYLLGHSLGGEAAPRIGRRVPQLA